MEFTDISDRKASIQTTAFNRYIWLPTLVLLVAIAAQFFLLMIRRPINKSYLN